MAIFFDERCACGREVCDFTCTTYAAYMSKQNNIGTWQERMKKEPITNADRIRSMSNEELAKQLNDIRASFKCIICGDGKRCLAFDECEECWLDWLKQGVE